MKLTFSFTNQADLSVLSADDVYKSHFELPDAIRYLIRYEERISAVAAAVGQLSSALVHLTCTELGIKNRPIKLVADPADGRALNHEFKIALVQFERDYGRGQSRQLKIYQPVSPVMPQLYFISQGRSKRKRYSLSRNLQQMGDWWCKTETDRAYARTLSLLADQLLMLLNAEASPDAGGGWRCSGFHPWWTEKALIDRHNKRGKRQEAERRMRERQAQRQAEIIPPKPADQMIVKPENGAGRRYGARPGKFMGVQMRSQLEIRFAAELQERGIQWVYEGEVLGDGGYLVDFYLPELNCWVEVKGQFEARDNYLLKEVAEYLKHERNHRLLVYTQTKSFVVNPSGFREVSHQQFWSVILKSGGE